MLGNPEYCVSATAVTRIAANQEQVFDWFTALDISRVLNGYGPLPGVERTVDQTGSWKTAGETRRLEMSGSITAIQEILICDRPVFFAYRVTGFTHILDLMVHGAEARWRFDQICDGATEMRWTYTFWPRSMAGKLAIYPVITTFWTWYMRTTIQEMKRIAERELA